MDLFSALLSGQAMTALAVAISLVMVIRNLTTMAGQLPDLRTRLDQVESLLEAQLISIPAVKKTIKEINEDISPRKELAQKLEGYYNALIEVERDNAIAEQKRKDAERIHLHRPGGAR
ncbi:MAG: hypothetical protein QGH25_00710 [Candidatus Latescibacteria bacterium]|jgi:hypothetical protein|nr:hypothetical protein [Candidatus Latescibacterota bacterium]